MKLMHLSDLHLGKRVHDHSMLPDQKYILDQILSVAEAEHPDGVLIAGDVYDKTVPPAEAVELFDSFLVALAQAGIPVFVTSGNHDSPERLAFGGRLMDAARIYLAPVYDGTCRKVTLEDEFGPVDIHLLPFVRPATLRRFFPETEITSHSEAVAAALGAMDIDSTRRNVLVAHQFVTGAATCESEELYVGGTENVEEALFDRFDYVALGHLHGPQNVSSPRIRYCGTPLKYSFSEAKHQKSVTIAELTDKLTLRTVLLTPLRDMAEYRGSFEALTAPERCTQDYVHIILTDEDEIPEALGRLRPVYPNLMKLSYDNTRTRSAHLLTPGAEVKTKKPLELFCDFYREQNGQDLSEDQAAYLRQLMERIWEEDV